MKEVTELVSNCYGCGVCVAACPKKCLGLELNSFGFYHPVMKEKSACVQCGYCVNNCSYLHDGLARNKKVIEWGAVWSNDAEVRKNSSSGGFAYELARKAIEDGFKVCGVCYNVEKHRAEHVICNTITELASIRGSKYIQSYTATAFKSFEPNNKYLVIGSPCQIDSLRRLIQAKGRENDFVLVDFFCHGVPSYHIWNKYVKDILFVEGNAKKVEFRHKWNHSDNKPLPWNSFVITGWDDEGNVFQPSLRHPYEDSFYRYFLGDLCLGKQCYDKCKFKMLQSSADIRIGDAWGNAFQSVEEGTSVVLAYTPKTAQLLKELQVDRMASQSVELEGLCEGQMQQSPLFPKYYIIRLNLMRSQIGFHKIDCILGKLDKWNRKIKRLYGCFCRHNNNA